MAAPVDPKLEPHPFIAPERYVGKLKGKVAIITGTSVGIGRAIAKAYAAAGASVACVARREEALNSLVEEIKSNGGDAIAIPIDVTAKGASQHILSATEKHLGPVDILINNAAISRFGPVAAEPEDMEIYWHVFDVNVRAPIALTRAVLPSMLERKSGTVISVTSGVATMAIPCMTAYASSKAAITKFHELLALELAGSGIVSFSLTPGLVDTELGKPDDAINKSAMEHPAMKAVFSSVSNMQYSAPELAANTLVALAAEPRCRVLDGKYISATRDLEPVVEEAEKEGGGRIGKEELYVVRIRYL